MSRTDGFHFVTGTLFQEALSHTSEHNESAGWQCKILKISQFADILHCQGSIEKTDLVSSHSVDPQEL
jgi:hypothetical protein